MRRTIFILAILLGMGGVSGMMAQEVIPGVSVEHFKMDREGKYLTVSMDMDLTALDAESNRAVLLTPRLVKGKDSLDLPSVGIYGRKR